MKIKNYFKELTIQIYCGSQILFSSGQGYFTGLVSEGYSSQENICALLTVGKEAKWLFLKLHQRDFGLKSSIDRLDTL